VGNTKRFVWLLSLFLLFIPDSSFCDNAEVLPKGVWSVEVYDRAYLSVTKRYSPDGDKEDVAADFNTTLNSNVFPALSLVEQGFGMPPGSANIGESEVSFKYDINILNTLLAYGITDRLSFGVKVPYWWVKNNVSATLNTTNATVGKNPFYGTPNDPFGGAPIIPISLGGVPFTDEEVQELLGPGLSINGQPALPGFGYQPVETWSGDGFGDIETGLKYQYYKSDNWRLAFTGGLRLPTGRVDDPDNLVDYGWGDGTTSLLFFFNNDYIGIKNLVLDATLNYYLTLPHSEILRVMQNPGQVLSPDKESLDRDLGDYVQLKASADYEFLPGTTASLTYQYGHKFEDSVKTQGGQHIGGMERETDYNEHVGIVGLSYSTIQLFQKKKFPVPMTASVKYRNRFAGDNRIFDSEYIELNLQMYF